MSYNFEKPRFLQYYVREKFAVISYGIFHGFNLENEGAWVPASRGVYYSKKNFIHITTGLQFGTLDVMRQILAGNEPYIFIEAGYLLAKPHLHVETWQLRVVANAYQQNWISDNTDQERLFELCMRGLEIQERKWNRNGYILFIPPSSDAVSVLFGLKGWTDKTIAEIKKYTDRPIVIRKKGNHIPLRDHLAGAHCVVAYTSNVATDAILAGIPAFCDKKAAAYPVANSLDALSSIESPKFPTEEERLDWLASLANNQFSLREIKAGLARKVVMQELEKRYAK